MKREELARVRAAMEVLKDLTDEEWGLLLEVAEKARKSKKYFALNEHRVAELIHKLGIPPHIAGYDYIREAVIFYMNAENPRRVRWVEDVYGSIAQRYETTKSKVERGIRYALEYAFETGNKEMVVKVFETTNKIPNSQAISKMVEYIKMNS